MAEHEIDSRLPFVWQTHTGSPTGYAQSAWVLTRAFWEAGLEVRYLFVSDDVIYEPGSPSGLVNALRFNRPDMGLPQVVYSTAPMFWHNSGVYKVGWSMMEVDSVNVEWVEACNTMDEVWVPTLLQSRYWVDSGVKVPVHVVPLGIDPRMFSPGVYRGRWEGPEAFRFLAVGWWQLRKRWDMLIRAFIDAFEGDARVHLVLKIHSAEPEEAVLHTMAQFLEGREMSNVHVVHESLDWWQLAALYRACQAFVLPTAGEGYGYPFLEALCCGLPVITTDGLGTGEVLRSDAGEPYPGVCLLPARRELTAVDHPYYAGGNWWVLNESDLVDAMRDVYRYYWKWSALAQEGAIRAGKERSCHVAARVVRERLYRIYEEHGPFPVKRGRWWEVDGRLFEDPDGGYR